MKNQPGNEKFRDEIGKLIEKYDMSVEDVVKDFSSFLCFIAVRTPDCEEFMEKWAKWIAYYLAIHLQAIKD